MELFYTFYIIFIYSQTHNKPLFYAVFFNFNHLSFMSIFQTFKLFV
nr:MAG TPA: hypothetical protein [Caudoviricetes sp.]